MTKRIVLLFVILAAIIMPATAATKTHRQKHSVSRSRKSKSKSMRKSNNHRTKSRRAKRLRHEHPEATRVVREQTELVGEAFGVERPAFTEAGVEEKAGDLGVFGP